MVRATNWCKRCIAHMQEVDDGSQDTLCAFPTLVEFEAGGEGCRTIYELVNLAIERGWVDEDRTTSERRATIPVEFMRNTGGPDDVQVGEHVSCLYTVGNDYVDSLDIADRHAAEGERLQPLHLATAEWILAYMQRDPGDPILDVVTRAEQRTRWLRDHATND